MAQCVFKQYQLETQEEVKQTQELMEGICVNFEVIYKNNRCTFKDGMSIAVAEFVCKQLKSLVYSDMQGVSVRTCWNGHFFYLNNVVYSMHNEGDICYLEQYIYKRKQYLVPLMTASTTVCFQVYLDASDVEDAYNNANTNSNITILQQYQRAQTLVDYCYHLVMDETPNIVPQPNIEVADNPMQVCSLQYQALWDIIVGYAYSDDSEKEILQQAKILAKVVTLDRQYATKECKDKLTDFLQQAIDAHRLQAACVHVVKECRKHISGFFLNLRSAGLPLSCMIYGQGKNLDHSKQIVQMYSLYLNRNFIKKFSEDVEEITDIIARTNNGAV